MRSACRGGEGRERWAYRLQGTAASPRQEALPRWGRENQITAIYEMTMMNDNDDEQTKTSTFQSASTTATATTTICQSATTTASIIRSHHQRSLTGPLIELDVRRGTASHTLFCFVFSAATVEDRSDCLSLCRARTAWDGPRAVDRWPRGRSLGSRAVWWLQHHQMAHLRRSAPG
jgi:hypothetical protein